MATFIFDLLRISNPAYETEEIKFLLFKSNFSVQQVLNIIIGNLNFLEMATVIAFSC